jgi:hypothetical protein
MRVLSRANSFNGCYFLISGLNREDKAGVDKFPVHDDRADTAISSATAFFRSFQSKPVS